MDMTKETTFVQYGRIFHNKSKLGNNLHRNQPFKGLR